MAIPPCVALYTSGSDPAHPVTEFAYLSILYGGLSYPLFAFLSLRWLRGRPGRAYWHFGIMAPLLYGVLYTAFTGSLLLWLYDTAADAFGWAAVIGAFSVVVGYGCVVLAAVLRYVFVTGRFIQP